MVWTIITPNVVLLEITHYVVKRVIIVVIKMEFHFVAMTCVVIYVLHMVVIKYVNSTILFYILILHVVCVTKVTGQLTVEVVGQIGILFLGEQYGQGGVGVDVTQFPAPNVLGPPAGKTKENIIVARIMPSVVVEAILVIAVQQIIVVVLLQKLIMMEQ